MKFDWINSQFILDIFTKDKDLNAADLEVEDIELSPASNIGDNYLATLVRVKATILVDGKKIMRN
jgi:hypothetical protein